MVSSVTPGSIGEGSPPANPWKTRLGILTMSHVLGTVNIMSILAMAPVIQRDLDLSVAQFGLLMTAYNGTQALVLLGVGNIIDRLGVGWSLFLAHLFLVGSTIL